MKKKKKSTIKRLKKALTKVINRLGEEFRNRSEYGFIYVIFSAIVIVLCLINFVELFKHCFFQLCKVFKKDICRKAACNWAIDLFIVLKFIFVTLSIFLPKHPIIFWIVLYLLIMNVFTYFYHHVWKKPSDNSSHWQIRRFVTLILAIAFNILCYVYLYWNGLARFIQWHENSLLTLLNVFQYSISNTFLLPSCLSIVNPFGFYLQTTQQIISFIFLAIILNQSIPQPRKED